jgi:mlo protein
MGSSYKRAILEEQLANVLRHWQGMVRDKKKTIQTPDTDNNSNNNNGDIDSGESPVQTEVASEFRFSGRQSPILQEIQIQEKTER